MKWVLLSILLAGCFDPYSLTRCDPGDEDRIPACRKQSLPTDAGDDDMWMSRADGGVDAAPAWDKNEPASAIAACKSGRKGHQLTSKMAACVANTTGVDQVCNDLQGWAPCQANQLSADLCAAVPWGFFGSRQHGRGLSQTPDASMVCSWNGGAGSTSTEQRFIFGCGKAAGATTYDITDSPCGGFQRAIPCHSNMFSAASSWDCRYMSNSDTDAALVTTSDMADGELCCHA